MAMKSLTLLLCFSPFCLELPALLTHWQICLTQVLALLMNIAFEVVIPAETEYLIAILAPIQNQLIYKSFVQHVMLDIILVPCLTGGKYVFKMNVKRLIPKMEDVLSAMQDSS